MLRSLVGSEMLIRDRVLSSPARACQARRKDSVNGPVSGSGVSTVIPVLVA